MALWRRLARYIEQGKETPKVDLKLDLDLSSRPNRAEFAKDVSAIANTPGGEGYIIVGVKDKRERQTDDPSEYVVGFAPDDPDELYRQMVDALSVFCNRVPTIDYVELIHPDVQRKIGVVVIPRSFRLPHGIKRSSGDIIEGQIWIRRGTASYLASVEEIEEMIRSAERPVSTSIVINLSTRPLTDVQINQIEQETYIEEIIEIPVRFDDTKDYAPQLDALIKEIGLSLEEWEQKSILILPPGLSAATGVLLAKLHGLMGHFPKLLRLRPTPEDASIYEVGEILKLQDMRNEAHAAAQKAKAEGQ